MLAMLFIVLATLAGFGAIALVVTAIVFNSVWMFVAAIGAGLLAWLFAYTADGLDLY